MPIWWSLPTWVLTNAVISIPGFLPRDHPWRGQWFTLRDWAQHQTTLCHAFDSGFWGMILGPTILLILKVTL